MSGEKKVALLAEGGDRNSYEVDTKTGPLTSPSSRRAWIEIGCLCWEPKSRQVALLAEGVDRNIAESPAIKLCPVVALLAEGVDRNIRTSLIQKENHGRPPRGGRG